MMMPEYQGSDPPPDKDADRGQTGDAVEHILEFVRARCIVDLRAWSFRDELWAAYREWAGLRALCRSRDEFERPLLAAKIAIIGASGRLIAGVGLREHWSYLLPGGSRTEGGHAFEGDVAEDRHAGAKTANPPAALAVLVESVAAQVKTTPPSKVMNGGVAGPAASDEAL